MTRPDWVSASVTARGSGGPVEVLSERSVSRRVFVFPDGRVEEEAAAGPVQFESPATSTSAAQWRRVDTSLVADGSRVRPAAVPGEVSLSGGGSEPVVSMTGADGVGAEVGLDGVVLPEPVLDGSTATYRDVVPGVDVRVEARPAGFELVWSVTSARGAEALVSRYGSKGEVVLPTTLMVTGADATATDGGVALVDGSKKTRSKLHAPLVWDAAGAKVQGHGTPKAAKFRLGTRSQVPGVGKGKNKSRGSLQVVTDAAWLTDPARVFPVTIDPTYAQVTGSAVFDTFVGIYMGAYARQRRWREAGSTFAWGVLPGRVGGRVMERVYRYGGGHYARRGGKYAATWRHRRRAGSYIPRSVRWGMNVHIGMYTGAAYVSTHRYSAW
ncbi:hypothetical protein [Luteococcus sanguinis]|uniref:Uncharacterized protein n=1 Tax=Luteococcus sanguinis TaxID=174038 RepID=A0ABW1X0X3_9ACTN